MKAPILNPSGWLAFFLMIFCLPKLASAAGGDIDTDFGTSGEAQPWVSGTIQAFSISNGKLLIGGDTNAGSNANSAVAMMTMAGQLDNAFGELGVFNSSYSKSNRNETVYEISQQDDKYIIMSQVSEVIGFGQYAYNSTLRRLYANGTADSTFGTGGEYNVNIQIGYMHIQDDGKIFYFDHSNLTRILADGSGYDNSFSGDGIAPFYANGTTAYIRGSTFRSNGKILALDDYVLAQFTSSGDLDTTFGNSGYSTLPDGNAGPVYEKGDGNLLLGGSNSTNAYLFELTSDGVLNTDFGTNGFTTLDVAGSVINRIFTLPDGGILCSFVVVGPFDTGLAAFTSSGQLDTDRIADGYILYSGSEWKKYIMAANATRVYTSLDGETVTSIDTGYTIPEPTPTPEVVPALNPPGLAMLLLILAGGGLLAMTRKRARA